MDRIETETVIDSLTHLESYYQSRYEHYLAMATEAKEHRERVGLLLQDLLRDETPSENYIVESRLIERQENNRLIERRTRDNEQTALLSSSSASREASLELSPTASKLEVNSIAEKVVDEDTLASTQVEQMRRFLQTRSIAMSVIESIVNSDSGKTLHRNYIEKILERELEQELSAELIELYLDEAITRGYVERALYDRDCYLAKTEEDKSAETLTLSQPERPVRQQHNLPPSNKLKPTLLETVTEYMVKCSPRKFSVQNLMDYLYPEKQRRNWSKSQETKVRQALANVLGRSNYLGKHWKRIKPGVDRPLT